MGERAEQIAAVVTGFFASCEAASLELPAGWFGRPYDNLHRLTDVTVEGHQLIVTFDAVQRLALTATHAEARSRVLRIDVDRGVFTWTEYGADRVHVSDVGAGHVRFHAPWARQ